MCLYVLNDSSVDSGCVNFDTDTMIRLFGRKSEHIPMFHGHGKGVVCDKINFGVPAPCDCVYNNKNTVKTVCILLHMCTVCKQD